MRRISIDLDRCVLPCLTCDMIVPGLRARIDRSGGKPLIVRGWAWLENGNRLTILTNSCPQHCIKCEEVSDIE